MSEISGIRLKYNAPITLTFALICTGVLIANKLLLNTLIPNFFAAPGSILFSFSNPLGYFRLVSHVIGHANWTHLLGNFTFILLLGPIIEEKYGSGKLFIMILVTALVTGLLNVLLFTNGLLGASGIVFMMILLASFTNIKEREIPLTFILICLLFVSKEVVNAFQTNNISEFAHLIGGLCGSVFGFKITK